MLYAQSFLRVREFTPAYLPTTFDAPGAPAARERPDLKHSKAEAERRSIRQALEACDGNRSRAARMLGVHRSLLYRKMAAHGLVAAVAK